MKKKIDPYFDGFSEMNCLYASIRGIKFKNSKAQSPKPKFQSPKSKFQIPNSKFQIPNSKFQIPNSKK